jgi:hypothetical protein
MPRIGIIAALLVAGVILVWPSSDSARAEGVNFPGDPNCDGVRTAIDALIVLQFAASLLDDAECLFNGDVDLDGSINALDALYILQDVAGLIDLGPKLRGGFLLLFLPFLYLGNPDYDCDFGETTAVCDTAVPDGSDYACTIDNEGVVQCDATEMDWPDYTCTPSLGLQECHTSAIGWPDYDCTVVGDLDKIDCETATMGGADYSCALFADTAECETPSPVHPDFTCDLIGSLLSCRA